MALPDLKVVRRFAALVEKPPLFKVCSLTSPQRGEHCCRDHGPKKEGDQMPRTPKKLPTPMPTITPVQVEQLARARTGLLELTKIFDSLGTLPRGPERNSLGWLLRGFSDAAIRAWSGPKQPRKPRRSKSSMTDGWIGG